MPGGSGARGAEESPGVVDCGIEKAMAFGFEFDPTNRILG